MYRNNCVLNILKSIDTMKGWIPLMLIIKITLHREIMVLFVRLSILSRKDIMPP